MPDKTPTAVLTSLNTVHSETAVQRITALWALSEAALGGVLHALRIPFTGLFVGSTAVIFITLIAFFARQKGAILRATLLVMIVKGVVSPHTPVTAYFAVTFQGIVGEMLFRRARHFFLPALLLGIFSLLQSAFQKIIILTLVFGKNLWVSIDVLGQYILNQLSLLSLSTGSVSVSFWLIGMYVIVHLFAGVLAGIFAGRIPAWVTETNGALFDSRLLLPEEPPENVKPRRKRRSWWKRPSGIFIFLMSVTIIVLSYAIPEFNSENALQVVIMMIRSLLVLAVWYFFAGPILRRMYKKFLSRKQHVYADEVETIVSLLPHLRRVVYRSWKLSSGFKKFQRIKKFIVILLVNALQDVPID